MKKISKNLNAIVLCGGKGTRLTPITENIPKPLIQINDKPILEYLLDHLAAEGIDNVTLATGYKSELIDDFVRGYLGKSVIKTVFSGDVDILVRIKDAVDTFDGDFLVLYGDTLSDVDVSQLITTHDEIGLPATITLWPLRSQFGLVNFDSGGKVTSFEEKPILNHHMNIGYFYFSRDILKYMEHQEKWEEFLGVMVKENILSANLHRGKHITVNTPEELASARKNIKDYKHKDKL